MLHSPWEQSLVSSYGTHVGCGPAIAGEGGITAAMEDKHSNNPKASERQERRAPSRYPSKDHKQPSSLLRLQQRIFFLVENSNNVGSKSGVAVFVRYLGALELSRCWKVREENEEMDQDPCDAPGFYEVRVTFCR
jgi:hypothetical protein